MDGKEVTRNCDFICGNDETIEFHMGKLHMENLECWLCKFKSETLEKLETDIFTCEICQCMKRKLRVKTLSDMKRHVEKEHEMVFVHHSKTW